MISGILRRMSAAEAPSRASMAVRMSRSSMPATEIPSVVVAIPVTLLTAAASASRWCGPARRSSVPSISKRIKALGGTRDTSSNIRLWHTCSGLPLSADCGESDVNRAGRESIIYGRSASPGRSLFQSGEEQPRRGQSRGSPRACALCPLFAIRNRDDAGAGAALRVSSHDYEFLLGIWRHGAQRFFAPMFQNQRDRFTKVRYAFFTRLALTVSPRYLCAIGDIPRAVLFDNCRELIAHGPILALPQRCKLPGR